MTTKSFLLACSVAAALLGSAPVRAENLIEVYLDAVRSDPLVREAEARRAAALEVKPQARALLLPQINVDGQYATREFRWRVDLQPAFRPDDDHGATSSVSVPTSSSSDVGHSGTTRAELTQSLFRWDQWQALKRADSQVAVAEADLSRRAAEPARARDAGLFRRARRRGHAERRAKRRSKP